MESIGSLSRNLTQSEREIQVSLGTSLRVNEKKFGTDPSLGFRRLTIISFGFRSRGMLAGLLCVLSLLGLGLGLDGDLSLRASCARLLERDLTLLVMLNTQSGSSAPIHTQEASLLFLLWSGAWP